MMTPASHRPSQIAPWQWQERATCLHHGVTPTTAAQPARHGRDLSLALTNGSAGVQLICRAHSRRKSVGSYPDCHPQCRPSQPNLPIAKQQHVGSQPGWQPARLRYCQHCSLHLGPWLPVPSARKQHSGRVPNPYGLTQCYLSSRDPASAGLVHHKPPPARRWCCSHCSLQQLQRQSSSAC